MARRWWWRELRPPRETPRRERARERARARARGSQVRAAMTDACILQGVRRWRRDASSKNTLEPRWRFRQPRARLVRYAGVAIQRTIRIAASFDEAARLDREDVAALSFEERISGVERLRRAWFGED